MTGTGDSVHALAWLERREPRAPEPLFARMAAALAGRAEPDVPEALAGAALACLRAAVEGGRDRAAAWDLLAADALLTYACEAAAEAGPAAQAILDRIASPDHFAPLLAADA